MHKIKSKETTSLSLKTAQSSKLIKVQGSLQLLLLVEEIIRKHLMENTSLEYWEKGGSL